jgi:ribosome production factor 1
MLVTHHSHFQSNIIMGKTPAGPSSAVKGKKPCNTAPPTSKRPAMKNPGSIKNKLKRSEVYGRYLVEKRAQKKQQRLQRVKEAQELGLDPSQTNKHATKTLDNTRDIEPTMVHPTDQEVMGDEAEDEFAPYFADTIRPKIILTTRPRPSSELFFFIHDLMRFIPQLFYYPRKSFSVKEICEYATNKDFTHIMVLSEKQKVCNGMIISHLRPNHFQTSGGPTAFFKVSHVIPSTDIPQHGSATNHVPELVLNGFGTRLGHRVGRFLGSIFPHNAQFQGRQVATFHNQRDYIFVRHHRYIFEEGRTPDDKTTSTHTPPIQAEDNDAQATTKTDREEEKKKKNPTRARLQELGPRFTLKLKWIQEVCTILLMIVFLFIHSKFLSLL